MVGKDKTVGVTSYTRMINGREVWVKPHKRTPPPKRRKIIIKDMSESLSKKVPTTRR